MDKKKAGASKKNGGSKPAKIVKKPVQPDLPKNWYYMSPEEITVSEIKDVLDPTEYDIEIWKEAGVLEIGVGDKASVDVEECEVDLGDDYSNDFLAENKVKSLFYVTIGTEQALRCQEVMKKIVAGRGGMFCADTDDFTPVIR